jgi:hypothetical protein
MTLESGRMLRAVERAQLPYWSPTYTTVRDLSLFAAVSRACAKVKRN